MLRRALLVLGVAGLLGALACLAARAYVAALYLFVESAVVTAGIVFERWRYVRVVNRAGGCWEPTGERFMDPATGRLVNVYYNPDTGERDYRPEGGGDGR
jgi:hypothetical protein